MANLDHYNGTFTANAQTFTWETVSADGAYLQFDGTYAGVTVTFEGTLNGGTTWFPVMGYQINSFGTAGTTQTLATNAQTQFYLQVGAAQITRVRVTAFGTGTCVVGILNTDNSDPFQLNSNAGAVSNFATQTTIGDSAPSPLTTEVYDLPFTFNGSTWDRVRGNVQATLDGSAARTASGNGTTQVNYNARGAKFFLNVTAASGTTPTLLWKIQWSYDGGTNWQDLAGATSASITTTGTTTLTVYPALPVTANVSINDILPRQFRTAWVIGGTTPSFTFASYVQYVV